MLQFGNDMLFFLCKTEAKNTLVTKKHL